LSKHVKDQPKSRRDDNVRGDELADLPTLAGLPRLSWVQLPERLKPKAALALDGSQTTDELSSTLVESKLLSVGDADDFPQAAAATCEGEAAVSTAVVAMFSEVTDSKVSCRNRFRAGDDDGGDSI